MGEHREPQKRLRTEESSGSQDSKSRGSSTERPGKCFTLKLLYLFAGAERKTSVVSYLRTLVEKLGWQFEAVEVDLKRGEDDDLTRQSLQDQVIRDISKGKYHVVICTPPCSTWTRARMANKRGPPPLRSREHVWGFPWVKHRYALELELGNELVRFSIRVWETVRLHPVSQDGWLVFLFGEHPEDLGVVIREEDGLRMNPASIWQLSAVRALVSAQGSHIRTVAISQCCWGTPWRKPTRLLASSKYVWNWGSNEWPQFNEDERYVGPILRNCNCNIAVSLARQAEDDSFRTSGTDIYPPRLDEAIAQAIVQHFQDSRMSSPTGGDEESITEPHTKITEETTRSLNTLDKEKRKSRDKEISPEKTGEEEAWDQIMDDEEEIFDEDPREGIPGYGGPIRCYYKGKFRTIHDGGGLCSPGRWPVSKRKLVAHEEGKRLASTCKRLFLDWLLSLEGEDAVRKKFWALAGGKQRTSPFEDKIGGYRKRLDEELLAMGFDPCRRNGDRETEVNFRRLKAMLEAMKDVDSEWLEEVAKEGVVLGVDEELPRVPEVFEAKERWNLSFAEEDFRDVFAENYKSAEENSEDIVRQVLEEVEKGSIKKVTQEEAERDHGGRLAIAALGAVPKELGSSVVRVVHDGSYSVDVNHRIKVRDRMRFPSVDDASGILMQVEDEIEEMGGGVRFSMLYDVAGAHKLVPVKKKDWGLQAFRLPGKSQEGYVFLHTRGTFGIASAAYWWQRLAAGLVRLGHNISGEELGLLHLLFADDGWTVALGDFFWRRLLFWLFFMDLCEVPLSWKKVRGGEIVHWIGYQIDIKKFEKGISEKKVRWIKDWMDKHLASGGVLGRDLKSALGRFSFVAGALHHVRPFLGPLFAWSARLSPGTFARFPDAVRVLLEYVKEQVEQEPMSRPRRLSPGSREAFRVDAKAEGELIVVGGWEVGREGSGEKRRWFSIELTRKNAPWAYVKGEPFRNIASLELVAVLVAIILFGDELVDPSCKNVLSLTASTDNMGNTYVLQHLMSCKYPLSIVVMEVAMQLRRINLELDLRWIPRGQNVAADALTNREFAGFDPAKRIEKNFEDIQFMVLDKLMKIAGELDEEIRMAKSSKEAKGDRPTTMVLKRKRGQTKWEDPW